MMSRVLFQILLFFPLSGFATAAFAASESHGHGGVPWTTIGVQTFNFLFLFSLLVYLLRAAVVAHFKTRRQSYLDLVGKAEAAKREAEANHREITQRLKALEETGKQNATRAQAEADALKAKLLKEADELSLKLKADARKTAEIEIQKARAEIESFALIQAIEAAQNKLAKDASGEDQSRLNNEFIKKIQAVNP